MKWVSAIAASADLGDAAARVIAELSRGLGDAQPDIVFTFFSPAYGGEAAALGELIRGEFPDAKILGCSAGGVVGAREEVEGRPAISALAGVLGDVEVHTFHVPPGELPEPDNISRWRNTIGLDGAVDSPAPRAIILLPDPFTCDTRRLLAGLDAAFEESTTVGGLASGGRAPGEMVLLVDDRPYGNGAVGLTLTGDVVVDTIVAQGCKPIGDPMFITEAGGHEIRSLDGQAALPALRALFDKLSDEDRTRAQKTLFLGLGFDAGRERYSRGDFLVRQIIAIDPASGALTVAAEPKTGDVCQFQVRDADTSAEDIVSLIKRYRLSLPQPASFGTETGVLLFTCLGRGADLYGVPHHDAEVIADGLDDPAIAGFFCNGEIGEVRGRTFMHGFTSAIAVIRPSK